MENKNCKLCGQEFIVFDEDLTYYKKISPVFDGKKYNINSPTLCPDCRQQRRLTSRNESKLYRRTCDLTGREVISIYRQDFSGTVYDQTEWWKDNWDPKKYGRDFDFSRSFFEQILELSLVTPRPCILNMSSENSLYTNHSAYNKNCYMCMNCGYSEDMIYGSKFSIYNKDCIDCLGAQYCELCYFCTHIQKCAYSSYLYECINCSDCHFCYDCQSCRNCFGCTNLRQKNYCIYNEQYLKDDYEQKLQEIMPTTWEEYTTAFEHFKKLLVEKAIHRAVMIENCINCSGDHLFNNKNVKDSYYTFESEDCRYCYNCGKVKDCYDTYEPYQGEMQLESHGCNLGYNLIACSKCYEDNNLMYCQYCWYSSNLFGCFGMRRAQYCILNKQYTKEEYENLVPKIIEHMQKTGEWGEYFPTEISPFAYNETVAMEFYPMSKEEVLQKGWKWYEEEDHERPFKIIPQELSFYSRMKLPIPLKHPDQRQKERLALQNPRKLWKRQCRKCQKTVDSSFAPERLEVIYCQECYLKTVY